MQFYGRAVLPDLVFSLRSPRPRLSLTRNRIAAKRTASHSLVPSPIKASGAVRLFIDASSGGAGTNMSIDGTMSIDGARTEYLVEANPRTLPDRRQLAAARKQPSAGYLDGVRRFAMLERDQEYMLAKRWREHGDRDAANQLVTSHLRLAIKIARNYRGYGLPVSELISEANVSLMQALERFEPDRGFRFWSYAVCWIRASVQDYILRSWSLVKIGTTASQKKLFFKLRSAKNKIAVLQIGDMHPDQVTLIAKHLGVADREVVDMNRRLGGDYSLNARAYDEEGVEWQDHLVDQSPSPEVLVAARDETDHHHKALIPAIGVPAPR